PALRVPHSFPTRRSSDLRDDRRENSADAIGVELLTRAVQILRRQLVLIEIDAAVAVHLEVEVIHRRLPRQLMHLRLDRPDRRAVDRKSTRLNSSHRTISY